MEFTPIDEAGKAVGSTRSLADVDQLLGTNLENMRAAMDHLSLQQTRLGVFLGCDDLVFLVLRQNVATNECPRRSDAAVDEDGAEYGLDQVTEDARAGAF